MGLQWSAAVKVKQAYSLAKLIILLSSSNLSWDDGQMSAVESVRLQSKMKRSLLNLVQQ